MITLRTQMELPGITGNEIVQFLLNCTDEEYQRWWPGTHLSFHTIQRHSGDVGNLVYMDEFIGQRRVKGKAIVTEIVPGQRVAWQMVKLIRLPVWFTLDLKDQGDQVRLTHTIEAGYRSIGSVLDPLLRLYFSPGFAKAMDDHVREEFPRLRDMLKG